MTGLEAIERIKKSHYTAIAVMGCERDYETEKAIEIVEKEHKVLEILKEKLVDVSLIKKYDFVADYNSAVWIAGRPKLVKEEFETIKEVLGE